MWIETYLYAKWSMLGHIELVSSNGCISISGGKQDLQAKTSSFNSDLSILRELVLVGENSVMTILPTVE
jgi:hypothetical protein